MNSFERNKKQKSKNTVSYISPSTLELKFDNFELSVRLFTEFERRFENKVFKVVIGFLT